MREVEALAAEGQAEEDVASRHYADRLQVRRSGRCWGSASACVLRCWHAVQRVVQPGGG